MPVSISVMFLSEDNKFPRLFFFLQVPYTLESQGAKKTVRDNQRRAVIAIGGYPQSVSFWVTAKCKANS